MPYLVKKAGDRWAIIRAGDGKTVGHSATREDAQASIRARMSSETKKKVK